MGEAGALSAAGNSLAVAEEFMARLPMRKASWRLRESRELTVAFGDAFAIALAQAEQASVITGDGEIRRRGLVAVDWVGL